MTMPTVFQQLVEVRLAEAQAPPLGEFIRSRRAAGPARVSYHKISDELRRLTGINVTGETIRQWESQYAEGSTGDDNKAAVS